MTAGDIGTLIVLCTGETGDPLKDYNIPLDATAELYVAPETIPASQPIGFIAAVSSDLITATYLTIGSEFSMGGYYLVQLRISGPDNAYSFESPICKKYVNPGFPT